MSSSFISADDLAAVGGGAALAAVIPGSSGSCGPDDKTCKSNYTSDASGFIDCKSCVASGLGWSPVQVLLALRSGLAHARSIQPTPINQCAVVHPVPTDGWTQTYDRQTGARVHTRYKYTRTGAGRRDVAISPIVGAGKAQYPHERSYLTSRCCRTAVNLLRYFAVSGVARRCSHCRCCWARRCRHVRKRGLRVGRGGGGVRLPCYRRLHTLLEWLRRSGEGEAHAHASSWQTNRLLAVARLPFVHCGW